MTERTENTRAATEIENAFPTGDTAAAPEKEFKEIPLKFSRKCVGNTFTAKDGKDYTSILIPNSDPDDHSPWETFVARANAVHEDQFGKGVWLKLPAEGHTTLRKNVNLGKDENGQDEWKTVERLVSNAELKEMVEFYKTRFKEGERGEDRPSVKQRMADKRAEVLKTDAAKAAPAKITAAEQSL